MYNNNVINVVPYCKARERKKKFQQRNNNIKLCALVEVGVRTRGSCPIFGYSLSVSVLYIFFKYRSTHKVQIHSIFTFWLYKQNIQIERALKWVRYLTIHRIAKTKILMEHCPTDCWSAFFYWAEGYSHKTICLLSFCCCCFV